MTASASQLARAESQPSAMGVPQETSNLSHMSGQPNPLHKALFDLIKRGDVQEVIRIVRESNLDIANLQDEPKNFS